MTRFSITIFLGITGAVYSTTVAQDSPSVPPSSKPSTTIITSVPFNGVNYFIKITPIDPQVRDNMPIMNPNSRDVFIWKDSVQKLFPDSVLKFLQKRENFQYKLNPKYRVFPKKDGDALK